MEPRSAQPENRFEIEKLEERIAPSGLQGANDGPDEADGQNNDGSFND